MLDRRRFLEGLAATVPLTLLTGCESILRALGASCPENTSTFGGIDWIPSVRHPVFAGYTELLGSIRIWYPTYEGIPHNAPMLRMCVYRWPLVLFLHGQPPCPSTPGYHRRWSAIPRALARSGYVVVVPSHEAALPQQSLPPDEWPLSLLDWVRDFWGESRWIDARPEATAIVGHSYGALLAARAAIARPSISSFVSLGAPWSELSDYVRVLRSINRPSLFVHTADGGLEILSDPLWDAIPGTKYKAVYPGEHFDYIPDAPECSEARGRCSLIEGGVAELVALFLSRFTRIPLARPIGTGLDPGRITQTARQSAFAGGQIDGNGRLMNLARFATNNECRIDLSWVDAGVRGSRRIGS